MATFVDTSALYALMDEADPMHDAADEVFRFLVEGEPMLTHAYVVSEAAAIVQQRLGSDAVRDLLTRLLPLLDIDFVDAGLHETAVTSLVAAANRTVSLVDWTSFAFMRARGIDDVFTFDADFTAQGFRVVPPPQDPGSAIST